MAMILSFREGCLGMIRISSLRRSMAEDHDLLYLDPMHQKQATYKRSVVNADTTE